MTGFVDEIERMERSTSTTGEAPARTHVVRLQRTYDASVEDVWDACTNPVRIGRWFLPVTGDLRLGGRFQLEGNAGGTVLRCEPPRLFRVTWEMGEGGGSEVEVRLTADGSGGTTLVLEHAGRVDPAFWEQYGPGAVGVGWDLALLGLGLHLGGSAIDDPEAWQSSAEALDLMVRSSEAWGRAFLASGATPEQARSAVAQTTAFYTGQPAPGATDGGADA